MHIVLVGHTVFSPKICQTAFTATITDCYLGDKQSSTAHHLRGSQTLGN